MTDTVIADPLNHARVPRMTITSDWGVPFLVLYDPALALVEFWDLRYPMTHFNREVHEHIGKVSMPGQFVSRYSLSTLVGTDTGQGRNLWSALALEGDEPTWRIDGGTMALVRRWLIATRDRIETLAALTTEETTT